MTRTAAEIKDVLRAPDFDSIVVWKPALGASADARIAFENAREAALRPVYGAKFGPLEILPSAEEYVALARERSFSTSPQTSPRVVRPAIAFRSGATAGYGDLLASAVPP